jgi:hypothetical protein
MTNDAKTFRSDRLSAILLVAGALAGVVVMALHPTAHGLLSPENGPRLTRLNTFVHGLALAAVPALFFALLGLTRRLGATDLSIAALVVWGFGGVAVTSAAVASGFVAPGAIARIVAENGSRVPQAFLVYTGLWNQGFAKVYLVASCAAILLWSAAILRGSRVPGGAGIAGIVLAGAVLAAFFAGHLGLDVHGFGVMTLAQSIWLVWIGIALWKESSESA